MPAKAQRIFDLLQETSHSLSDRDNWIKFLKTAAWQYKYPFADQILIYAQRPDATACARIEVWNSLHRRVDRGAKGIALLRENGSRYGLEYVFDVSDTHDQFYRGLRLWKYNDNYSNAVIETLESSFGELQSSATIHEAILSAAHNAVQDNKGDYINELKYAKRGSFLSGLDDANLDLRFRQTAEASVAYMIMERMGLNPENIIDSEDFEHMGQTEPITTITCEWSESPVFKNGTIYSVAEFDDIMKKADAERVAGKAAAIQKYGSESNWAYNGENDEEFADYFGYDKVQFTVNMPNGEKITQRQDIGDGDGGVIDFFRRQANMQNVRR